MTFAIPEWLTGAAVIWIYGALVQALPCPDQNSSKFYTFLYQFLHLLAANISLVQKVAVAEQKTTAVESGKAVWKTVETVNGKPVEIEKPVGTDNPKEN